MDRIEKEAILKKWFEEQNIVVEDLREGTVGALIWQARNDERTLWRAGRNVFRAMNEPLPDGRTPEALCDSADPCMQRLYHDQPKSMMRIPLFDDFYFLEPTFARLLNYFQAVKSGHEEEHMILWVWGVGGVGKSEIMKTLALRLEDFTYPARKGCEFHGNPLYLVPRTWREALYPLFYFFKGNPCGSCQNRVREEYENRWWDFPIEHIPYSLNAAHGIAFVEQPLVPKKEGDYPDQWYQILQHEAPGGVFFLGCAKEPQPTEFITLLAEIAQSGTMNSKASAARVDLDMAIVVLSNAPVQNYRPNDFPFYRRVVELPVPAVVSSAAEERIHAKLERFADPLFHFMPGVEQALNLVVCASRIRDTGSPEAQKLMERLFLYDGMLVPGENKTSPLPKTESRRALFAQYPKDGMEEGFSLGAAIKMRAYARERAIDGCITIIDVLAAARNQLLAEGWSSSSGDVSNFPKKLLGSEETEEEKKKGEVKIGPLEGWYQQRIERDLATAWIGPDLFEKHLCVEAEAYKRHLRAYLEKQKFVDENEEELLDEGVLKRVEEQIGVIGSQADTWRTAFSSYVSPRERRGESMHFSQIPRFEEALVKKVSSELVRELRVAFDFIATDKPRDPDKERKKKETLVKNLLDDAARENQLGYKVCCVKQLLGEAPGTGYLRKRLYPKK